MGLTGAQRQQQKQQAVISFTNLFCFSGEFLMFAWKQANAILNIDFDTERKIGIFDFLSNNGFFVRIALASQDCRVPGDCQFPKLEVLESLGSQLW